MIQQAVPFIRAGTQAKTADHRVIQPPFVQIIQHRAVLWQPQLFVVEHRGLTRGFQQPITLASQFLLIWILFQNRRSGQVKSFGQIQKRFGIGKLLHFHHKLRNVAARLATKTVIQIQFRIHREGRGLLVMERTKSPMTLPLLLQMYIIGDNINDAGSSVNLVNPGARKTGGHFSHRLSSVIL